MIHLNGATKVALKPDNNTLDKKLHAFIGEMLKADEFGKMASEEIRIINEDVVYFVLNGNDVRNDERAFVSGVNWANLDERVIDRTIFNDTVLQGQTPESEVGNRTQLYSTKRENLRTKSDDAQYINQSWNLVWEDYLRLTKEEESKNNLLTFNHWLLNRIESPINIGFYWGEQETTKELDGGYFYLPDETLRKLNASEIRKYNFNPLQLPREFNSSVEYDRALNAVKLHMEEMGQDKPELNTVHNIGFAAYHIIRSYGCWGGSCFYSIPINLGFANERRIGVLSICSKKPLNESSIERWSLVATKIIKDIIPPDIDLFREFERQNHLIEATYGVSHLFGNLIEEFETPFIALKGFSKKATNADNAIKNINEVTEEIERGFQKFKEVSKIIHILSKAIREKDGKVFERNGWHTKEPHDLYSMILDLEKRSVENKKCKIEFDGITAISVLPFINDNTILPAKFIYENVLLELLINCLKYHSEKVAEKKMVIGIDSGRLVFRNLSNDIIECEWGEIDAANSGGAILYFAYLLRETKIGKIYRRKVKEGSDFFFEIAIELRGLNIT